MPQILDSKRLRTLINSLKVAGAVALLGTILLVSESASALGILHSVRIGSVHSAKVCTTYVMSSGKSSLSVNRYSLDASESWRTWLVKDCNNNFATMRSSLEAALASTGKLSVGGGGYIIDMVVSDVGDSSNYTSNTPGYQPEAYANASSSMFVNVDIKIRDHAGQIVYGGMFTKSIQTGAAMSANEFTTANSQSGQAVYGVLQHEMALAAARIIAFHIEPLRVIGGNGHDVQLNYGSPLLQLGTLVQVTSMDGAASIKYRVTSANDMSANAEKESDGDILHIGPGSRAIVIEGDDPAANSRRTKREELP